MTELQLTRAVEDYFQREADRALLEDPGPPKKPRANYAVRGYAAGKTAALRRDLIKRAVERRLGA